ncbi:MAG: hypothetical protein ABL890_04440 [Candidatus Peribacteraceae bacterium]
MPVGNAEAGFDVQALLEVVGGTSHQPFDELELEDDELEELELEEDELEELELEEDELEELEDELELLEELLEELEELDELKLLEELLDAELETLEECADECEEELDDEEPGAEWRSLHFLHPRMRAFLGLMFGSHSSPKWGSKIPFGQCLL